MINLDILLFTAFPYFALFICIVGSIYRYKFLSFKYSSLSSEFLEQRKLFWGTIPFHIGISPIFLGHLFIFIFPKETLAINSYPLRLIIIEAGAFILGLSALVGLTGLFIRRLTNKRINIVTSKMDIFIEALLLVQIFLGVWIAFDYRWGSSWFAAVLSPYL